MKQQNMVLIVLLLALNAWNAHISAQDLVPVNAADNSVYDLLERAYAHGLIRYLPQIRPLPVKEITSMFAEARGRIAAASFKAADIILQEIEVAEKHLATLTSGKLNARWQDANTQGSAYLKFSLSSGLSTLLNNPADTEWFGTFGYRIGLNWGTSLFLGLENDFHAGFRPNTMNPETGGILRPFPSGEIPDLTDDNIYTYILDSSAHGGFNHNQVHTPGTPDLNFMADARNQAILSFGFGTVSFTRQKASWGPGPESNAVLSHSAKPYDSINLSLNIGNSGRFVWNAGYLQQESSEGSGLFNSVQKMVTMHRIEYQITPWLLASIFETIIYNPRFELSYLNPFSLYYISEVRNGDTDNKLGGVDFTFRHKGLKAYVSLFADDWDFGELFNFGYFHNIFSAQAGVTVWDIFPGLKLWGEYTYLSHWMYTHRDDYANRYIHYGDSLGHTLQPNSHRMLLDAVYSLKPETRVGLRFTLIQRGRGSYFEDGTSIGWDIDGMYAEKWGGVKGSYNYLDIGMPGAFLETTFQTRISGETSLPWKGFSGKAAYTLQYQDNADRVEGAARFSNFLNIAVFYEF